MPLATFVSELCAVLRGFFTKFAQIHFGSTFQLFHAPLIVVLKHLALSGILARLPSLYYVWFITFA